MIKKLPVKNTLAVQTEQALLERLPVDQKTLRLIGRILEPKNLKRIGIAAIGGSVLITLINTYGRDSINRAATAKEMKKQLVPLQKKLELLEAEIVLLSKQNEELKEQLDKYFQQQPM